MVDIIDVTGEPLNFYHPDRYWGTHHSSFTLEAVLLDIAMLLGYADKQNPSPRERAEAMGKPRYFANLPYKINGRPGTYWTLVGNAAR